MNDLKISLKNISKSYNRKVLDEISIEINNESYFSVCGKSGAGKSTFMNIIGLIEDYDKGEFIFNDIKIIPGNDYADLRNKEIGFIFQNYNLITNKSVMDNILLPLQYSGNKSVRKEQVFDLIEKLKLDALVNENVNVLSGGEKQRVAIARALLLDPSLIIADEPTGNLDIENSEIVMDILGEEHKKGRGIVLITHDMEVAKRTEQKLILESGKLNAY